MREEFADILKGFAKSTKCPVPFPSYWFDLSYELRIPPAWMAGWILNPPSPADCFPISCIATCLVPFVLVSDLGLNLPAEVFVSESDCIET